MTLTQFIAELEVLAAAGHGGLRVLADGDAGFYEPVVALDAHGSLSDPKSEKYVRISPT